MRLNSTVIILLAFVVPAACQEAPPPGGMQLLPGFHHQSKQSIDSTTGRIWKKGGLEIHYDIGQMAGDYTECEWCGWTKGEVWRKTQVVNGQQVICVFTKKKRLVVSFPKSHANFFALIHTESELTDMLLITLTFRGFAEQKVPA
jgi:hypothetical protein